MALRNDQLPIHELRADLLRELPRTGRVIIEAPTGSGKSTQVPQMLLDGGLLRRRQVVVLQPRRIAARMLARRVARERGGAPGGEVGYQVRFENHTDATTRIKYETDGVILREFIGDPALAEVDTIIFDEFHERHMYGDIMLGLALKLQAGSRPDLRIVVMSATLDTDVLAAHLEPCAVLRSSGRMFPVTLRYLPRQSRATDAAVWDLAAAECGRLLAAEGGGDILVFMPGAYEIRRTIEAVQRLPAARHVAVLPLHGDLPPEQQDAAVEPSPRRKIVVATNVAETSLTIEGIRHVIDSGLARKARFDANRGINTLLIEKISRAAADQRAGRAGRVGPGDCLRLWTEQEHGHRDAQETPEIRRVDLSETILLLKQAGIDDPAAFPWLDAPDAYALARSLALLRDLGALDGATGALTALGARMLAFPMHPRYARMLIEAERYGCVPSAALMAALTQDRSILLAAQNHDVVERRLDLAGNDSSSDLILLMAAWRFAREHDYAREDCERLGIHGQAARQAGRLYDQFLRIAEAEGLDTYEDNPPASALRRCILAGFSDQLARAVSPGAARYEMVHRRRGTLERGSVVRSDMIVASEIREVQQKGREVDVRLSLVTAVEPAWLREAFPRDFKQARRVSYDAIGKRVTVALQTSFRDLVLEERRADPPTTEEAAGFLAAEVCAGRLVLKEWNHQVEQWILRVNTLARHCPDLGLPALTEADRVDLVAQVCHGAIGYKDIKDRPVWPVVRAWLPPAQAQLLDRHAPERIALPNGREPRLTYEATADPYISLRIQELYGVEEPLFVCMGRVRVVVHILAPNQRPVQITNDLESFWRNNYPAIRSEYKRRYPKHEWR